MLKILIALLLASAAAAIYVRLAPSDPKIWHIDPLKAKLPNRPNAFLMLPDSAKNPSQVFDKDAKTLALAFDSLALSKPHVQRLAGDPADLFTTYIARTPLMRFPDYISVRAVDLGNGRAALAIFSRARFGYSDRGVNRKRILAWLAALAP